MKKKRRSLPFHTFLSAGLAILFLFIPGVAFAGTLTQTSTNFSPTKIENQFPNAITFRTHIESNQTIIKAQFFFYERNCHSTTRVDLQTRRGKELDLEHTLNTANQTTAPSTPIFYYWQVTLEDGEVIKTEEELVYYDDIRFDWQVREKDQLSVWWHDRPATFGEKTFEIAVKAFDQQKKLFQIDLDYPVRIIVYNNKDEFAAWDAGFVEFIGGMAFPQLGITTQIVDGEEGQDYWLNEVIPHELSHLYFYQGTYHAISTPPAWLDEGVAQYNEFKDQYWERRNAKLAIQSGNYIPLKSLTYGFGTDREKVNLAYDESISAVSFLIKKYGHEGLIALMTAYKNGQPTSEAFAAALGVTLEDFEIEWLASLGVPDGIYPTSPDQMPSTPTPTFDPGLYPGFWLVVGVLAGLSVYCSGILLIVIMLVAVFRKKGSEKQ